MLLPASFARLLAAALWTAALLALPLPALAAEKAERKAVVSAGKHYRLGNPRAFAQQAAKIGENSVYQPLIAYWRSLLALRRNDTAEVKQYIAGGASPYFQQQARRQLLEHYAARKQWDDYRQYAAGSGGCAEALGRIAANAADAGNVRALWQADGDMKQPLCMSLYRRAYARDIIVGDDVWIKLRALAGDKKLGPSRRLLSAFRGFISYRQVRSVVRRATRYIQAKHGLGTRAQRELVMISAMVAVRKNPKTAMRRWQQFSQYFSAEENDHVQTVLATWAARWHRDDALERFAAVSGRHADGDTHAWRVRAALRAGDYAEVLRGIAAMSPDDQRISAWRYWRAIALQKTNAGADATAALQALAQEEDDFYGLLAREAIGLPLVASAPPPPPAAMGGDFALALALHQAGLRTLARTVWRHAARREGVEDAALIAAAQHAAQAEWYLASIDAASRAESAAAHHLRFPFPYRDHIFPQSKKRGLDAAFVYGLIHQESRFSPKIVSSANARGLMQVIPRTARHVARANGYSRYRLSRLTRVDTNVTIGTTYLRSLADSLEAAPAMVAAAYNAGPTRVRRWFRASPDLLVAIENIPITETRLYVKYLLANRAHYAARLGQEVHSLRALNRRPMLAPQ